MPVVNLPPGCQGLELGGRTYHGRGPNGGGYVNVPGDHAALIASVDTGDILSAGQRITGATGPGRVCPGCGRRWYRWTATCHTCKAPTIAE
jgi:hypothetical protein